MATYTLPKLIQRHFFVVGPVYMAMLIMVWGSFIPANIAVANRAWGAPLSLSFLPIVIVWHTELIKTQQPKHLFIIYALVHMTIFGSLWLFSCMRITSEYF